MRRVRFAMVAGSRSAGDSSVNRGAASLFELVELLVLAGLAAFENDAEPGLPLRIEYQPRPYLRITLEHDPAVEDERREET